MSFRNISYLQLWWPSYSPERNNFGTGHYEEHYYEIYFEVRPEVQEMQFKDISYLQLWCPSYLAEWNHLAILVEDIMRNILWNYLDQWSSRCCFEIFLIYSSGGWPSCLAERNYLGILVKGIMWNICVKLF